MLGFAVSSAILVTFGVGSDGWFLGVSEVFLLLAGFGVGHLCRLAVCWFLVVCLFYCLIVFWGLLVGGRIGCFQVYLVAFVSCGVDIIQILAVFGFGLVVGMFAGLPAFVGYLCGCCD